MQHIIIGAGPAGVIAAETMRKADPDADITIIGDEPEPPYSRMAIPYYLINNIGESGTYLRDPDQHFKTQKIEVVQQRVDKIDAAAKKLNLADGSTRRAPAGGPLGLQPESDRAFPERLIQRGPRCGSFRGHSRMDGLPGETGPG